jgi:hypothetical protein
MLAHQIIQTSCLCGINGAGSGFQVYSCSAELYNGGFTRGNEYQKLFIYDTPAQIGQSAFGYASVDGLGGVFNFNTRLAYDYAGAGTRSGNLLNHALLIDGGVNFYPAEMFGSAALRSQMAPSEVNSAIPPAPLAQIDVGPSGVISLSSVSEWIAQANRLDALLCIVTEFFEAYSQNKTLVILDEPKNLIWWIAALEYCLPLPVVKQLTFLTYSDNPAGAGAQIVGSTRAAFEANTSTMMRAACVYVDVTRPYVKATGAYLDFLEATFDLNPEAVSEFLNFAEGDLACNITLPAFNAAYALYNMQQNHACQWTDLSVQEALDFAKRQGSNELRHTLGELVYENLDNLKAFEDETYFAGLLYVAWCLHILNAPASAEITTQIACELALTSVQHLRMLEEQLMEISASDFAGFANVVVSIECGILQASSNGLTVMGSTENSVEFDNLWCLAINVLCDNFEVLQGLNWLLDICQSAQIGRYRYVYLYFEKLISKTTELSAASDTFGKFCSFEIISRADYVSICLPEVIQTYVNWLESMSDKRVDAEFVSLLKTILATGVYFEFMPILVERVSTSMNVKRPAQADIALCMQVEKYQNQTGILALCGKASLIAAANLLECWGSFTVAELTQRLAAMNVQTVLESAGVAESDKECFLKRVGVALRHAKMSKARISENDIACILDSLGLKSAQRARVRQHVERRAEHRVARG